VFLGPSGVGKTHLATSIGIAAAKKRTSTYFIKCHDLLQNLKRAKIEILGDSQSWHVLNFEVNHDI
ncbi:ATP-binding protein, partial [Bacillus thuringiensis]|uniref:ATP-binding protein n=1 Tax=Bacillus thuringiensis TaxID=1428 RepID=UPI0037D738C9